MTTGTSLNPIDIINKILKALTVVDVFTNLNEWKTEYQQYAKLIHPDICKEAKAQEATTKLNQFKDELENGKKFKDDAGIVSYTFKTVTFIGDENLLKKSYDNYNILMSFTDKAAKFFQQYLPVSGQLLNTNELEFTLPLRGIPLCSIGTTEQKHVNWMVSRMLELTAWINQIGYSHCGINPDSIFVIPENHGMICTSFYYLTRLDTPLKTISGKYQNLYPTEVFKTKKATSNIDIELVKRTAIYMLGDMSGSGAKLRKTHENEIIDFLVKRQYDASETFKEHKTILRKYFDTKQFHIFNH